MFYYFEKLDLRLLFICWFIFTMLLMATISYFFTGETDTIYEEMAEDIIEHHTGVKLDFSPASPE